MPGKSRIETELASADLAEFQRLLATGRLTIDAMALWLESKGYEISRSSVGRYAQNYSAVAAKLRQSREMTEALVREIGPSAAEGQQGRLLVEILRKLAFDHLVMQMDGDSEGGLGPEDFFFLSKALKEMAGAARPGQRGQVNG